MSTHIAPGAVPEWDLTDRMIKALKHAELTYAGIADLLGVRAETVSRWLTGKQSITERTVRQWAMATGVDFYWLSTGRRPSGGGGPGVRSFMPYAALAQSAERFTRNEEWNASRRFRPSVVAA